MPATLTIGDFSRVGLLAPADVDAGTGYRRYTAGQNAWRTEICWPIFSTGTIA